MDNYLDAIMTNHNFVATSSDENINNFSEIIVEQYGGDPKNKLDILKNVPTGSFPPIFLMTPEEQEKEEKNKARLFSASTNKTALSIKEIMQERRDDKKPFISL